MTPQEPPRKPKPVTREHAEEVAKFFHTSWTQVSCEARPDMAHAFPEWEGIPSERRDILVEAAYRLLDHGWIMNLDSNETHALVEHLLETGMRYESAEASPVDPAFQMPLLLAFRKLAFANGRHYGLTNFDMGIEED